MNENLCTLSDLNEAIRTRDVAKVAAILKQQPELASEFDEDQDRPFEHLFYFTEEFPDDEDQVIAIADLLLQAGVDVNDTVNFNGDRPLHHAAAKGYVELSKMLISKGASLNMTNRVKETPMSFAIYNGDMPLLLMFIELGAWLFDKELVHAVTHRNKEMVIALLELGLDIHYIDFDGYDLLFIAITRGGYDLVKFFLEKGLNPNRLQGGSMLPLHHAAAVGKLEMVKCLLQYGADVHAVEPKSGNTALFGTVLISNREVMSELLASGANINAVNNHGNTPLHLAVNNRMADIIPLMVQKGANLNQMNHNGLTPLAYAITEVATPEALALAKEHTTEELRRLLNTRHDKRYPRSAKNLFKKLTKLYEEKTVQVMRDALHALQGLETDPNKMSKTLRLAHVGLFSTCKHPEAATQLPWDIQIHIARKQLETDFEPCERLMKHTRS